MERSKVTKLASPPILTLLAAVFVSAFNTGCNRAPDGPQFLARGRQQVEKKEYARALIEFRNASRLLPRSAEPYHEAALAYLALGDYRTAYLSLIKATEVDPNYAPAHKKLAELIGSNVAGSKDPEVLKEAERRVQAALAIAPESTEALSALGMTEYMMGKPENATKHLEAALNKFPQNLQAAKGLASIRLNQKDFAGAEEILKKVAAESKSGEAYVALARFYLLNSRVADAEATYRRAISINPKNGAALADLARLQFSQGKKDEAEKTILALSTLPDPQYRSFYGIYLFEQGKHAEAIKEFERRVAEDPKDRAAFGRLVSAYLFLNRFPDAETLVRSALKKNPKDTDALLERGRLYLITSKVTEAQNDLQQVLKLQPDSAIAHYLLAGVHRARGERLIQRDQLGEALRLDPNLLAARVALVQALIVGGAAKTSLEIIKQAPKEQADALPLLLERNWALLGTNERGELKKSIDRGLSMYPGSTDLKFQDALLKLENKDYAGCRKALDQVLAANPQYALAIGTLVKSYLVQNQPALARQTLDRFATQYPQSAPIQSMLGQYLAANGDFPGARKAFKTAIAADPTLLSAQVAAAYVELADQKFADAKRMLESIPSTPTTSVERDLGLAQLEEKMGNKMAAIPHYRRVIEADPNNLPALNSLAYLLANDGGQVDEALKYAQRAAELSPNSPFVEDTLGWVFYRKGLYSAAVQHLENAVAKNPLPVLKYHLAMAYLKSGDVRKGRSYLERARAADPAPPEAQEAARVLAEVSRP